MHNEAGVFDLNIGPAFQNHLKEPVAEDRPIRVDEPCKDHFTFFSRSPSDLYGQPFEKRSNQAAIPLAGPLPRTSVFLLTETD
jgi:hypothetical protein